MCFIAGRKYNVGGPDLVLINLMVASASIFEGGDCRPAYEYCMGDRECWGGALVGPTV